MNMISDIAYSLREMETLAEKEVYRRFYQGRVAYLDDCGESKSICNRCSNRYECLKRVKGAENERV